MPKALTDAEINAIANEVTEHLAKKSQCSACDGAHYQGALLGVHAVLDKLNIQATTEIGAYGCTARLESPPKPSCEHFDYDTGCELCLEMPAKGALLVRRKAKEDEA